MQPSLTRHRRPTQPRPKSQPRPQPHPESELPPEPEPEPRRGRPAGCEPQVLGVVDGADTADYVAHTATLRGVVRQRLVTRALIEHLPPAPARLLDIGGGNGVQALEFARRGYDVTVCEPDPLMLSEARRALADTPQTVRRRVTLVQGDGRDAVRLVGTGWDATFCHGVVMFVPEPEPLLTRLVELTRPGGIVSVVGKNGPALALRAGLQGRWCDATAQLGEPEEGDAGLRPPVRLRPADDPATIAAILTDAGTRPLARYGIRIFTDHLGDIPPGPDADAVVDAEWAAGARDPYRAVARLIHHVHRRTERPVPPASG